MPLRRELSRHFHRCLMHAGISETVRLLKRKDDQLQGTVTAYTLFYCRRSIIYKTSQTIQADMSADHRCVWHIPRIELERNGIHYINALDRIVQIKPGVENGWYWQPESTTIIEVKLFGNEIHFDALRVDPPLLRSGYQQGYF